jgi:hypothetical protein
MAQDNTTDLERKLFYAASQLGYVLGLGSRRGIQGLVHFHPSCMAPQHSVEFGWLARLRRRAEYV